MNSYEKDEIRMLPSQYRPLGAWSYFGYSILFSLPLIGFIALLICAFSDSNIVRRSFARSYFCSFLVVLIVLGIAVGRLSAGGGLEAIMEIIRQGLPQ